MEQKLADKKVTKYKTLKILIINDYNIFRSGLKTILEQEKNFEVVDEVYDASGLFDTLKIKKPHVIIMDLILPHKQVLFMLKQLTVDYPDIYLILLTVGANEFIVMEGVLDGSRRIVWKENTTSELVKILHRIAEDDKLTDCLNEKIPPKLNGYPAKLLLNGQKLSELSERELEVLKLFAEGFTYKEIAVKLNISTRTVESHKNNILNKLGLCSVIEMVKFAIKNGLIQI